MDQYGYMKVAAVVPSLRVADCTYNVDCIVSAAEGAERKGAEAVLFPELSITGYTAGDLLLQPTLTEAAGGAIKRLAHLTCELRCVVIVGCPVPLDNKLYNCAVVLCQGKILGIVPKSRIPGYGEFYEPRWFASGADLRLESVCLGGQSCPIGVDLLFEINGVRCGIELCEDLWVPNPPSLQAVAAGAEVIFNLSASPEQVGKHEYLVALVEHHSARTRTGYIYCSSGFGESSTDLVFAGNALIFDQGEPIAATERFCFDEQTVIGDIDVERIRYERRRTNTFSEGRQQPTRCQSCSFSHVEGPFTRRIDPTPFVPQDDRRRDMHCCEILSIQCAGLAKRLGHTGCRKLVIGISGGLDSTLALLVAVRTFDLRGYDRQGIIGITMPGFGTTDRTHDNAVQLMRELGITVREIPIAAACRQHLSDIGLPEEDRSATYENAQARERTQILMDVANMEGALVLGTGDLSELALGWATYNGDQMSMYGINSSVPKTLVRHLVAWMARQEQNPVRGILLDVIDTPVSPELLPAEDDGTIAQKTEELVGPYELHDFFLYQFMRRGAGPAKILFLAEQAFDGKYDRATIVRWMRTFFQRFFAQQFKRSAMPDGPKVGSVSLSPRGDWRMPSDATAEVWLDEMKFL